MSRYVSWCLAWLFIVSSACGDDAPPTDVPQCDSDVQCDDGIFCNGSETCAPMAPGSAMQRPVAGTALPWVEQAVDPGVKGEPRSREKMALDYGGEAAQLKDLARITLVFRSCAAQLNALRKMDSVPGWRVVQTKNKVRFPTPMVRGRRAAARSWRATH